MHVDWRRLLAESIGTFFLVLIGPGAAVVNAWSNGVVTHAGIALAFVVVAMIYGLGHLSGAHINPAVTAFSRARCRSVCRGTMRRRNRGCRNSACISWRRH